MTELQVFDVFIRRQVDDQQERVTRERNWLAGKRNFIIDHIGVRSHHPPLFLLHTPKINLKDVMKTPTSFFFSSTIERNTFSR